MQKKLLAHRQLHRDVNYCIYDCRWDMLSDIFTSPSMPFYQFDDLIFL